MLVLLRDSWDRIQPELRTKAGAAAYESWLHDLRPLALERGICYLEARNRLSCDRVQCLFAPLLEDLVSREIGTRSTVRLTPRVDSLIPDRLEVGPTRPVIDDSNRTAFLVLRALLEERSDLPARLFLFWGPKGAGKTFLLSWWCHRARPRPQVHDGLTLRKAFQVCVRDRRTSALHEELCADVPLVIDGIHRFSGFARAQRELLAVLQARAERDKPVLLTSRWHPSDIWKLDPALQSYLLSGFVADVDLPGPAARLQYLRALAGSVSRNGRADDIETMARQVHGGYLDLRRAWALRRHGLAGARHSGYLQLIDPGTMFRQLHERVASRLRIPQDQIVGRSQQRKVSFARQVLAYLCVQEGLSQAEVGRYLGRRSRAAISYCIKTLEQRMARSAEIRAQVEALL
jgi:chromosomal replication initiation ATPase DnaA